MTHKTKKILLLSAESEYMTTTGFLERLYSDCKLNEVEYDLLIQNAKNRRDNEKDTINQIWKGQ